MTKALVTGCAGFIGSHLTQRLLSEGVTVIGIDGFLDNYDVAAKLRNLAQIGSHPAFTFHSTMLQAQRWKDWLEGVDVVYHLAALPGVRNSWGKAFTDYVNHNILATQMLLEACLQQPKPPTVVVSSSSSVYGTMQGSFTDETAPLRPVSPYGVTKESMEQICQVYVKAYGLRVTMLRYFTVYGPRQRPDMAFHRFFRQLMKGEQVTIFGDGQQSRDFTYVADAVQANILAAKFAAPGEIFNVGGDREIKLLDVLAIMGGLLNVTPKLTFQSGPAGDSKRTCADITLAQTRLGYKPQVPLEEGLRLQLADMRAQAKG
ncbi:NAD-dependent epimerase/dehydratase family protein [Brevibacillus nitrificans]|uniref:NAD-dependent epimerase/dehydratase family protein n=1 Tax=Brevibacillus nitrificans TaxID=651560 RepID=A0A3M8DLP2_9BACL|nr:NAD-dependent epimerase/dehydratase family protein [Brevibacillus nitrificans]RNB88934.1 NAD-dependent epimerase/dehydratase family protein [Brevibacillus nitrificans]